MVRLFGLGVPGGRPLSTGDGITRGGRRRNARKGRLRALVPQESVVAGLDLGRRSRRWRSPAAGGRPDPDLHDREGSYPVFRGKSLHDHGGAVPPLAGAVLQALRPRRRRGPLPRRRGRGRSNRTKPGGGSPRERRTQRWDRRFAAPLGSRATTAPLSDPTEVPATTPGTMSRSPSACSTPTCTAPRLPPPSTYPTGRGRSVTPISGYPGSAASASWFVHVEWYGLGADHLERCRFWRRDHVQGPVGRDPQTVP